MDIKGIRGGICDGGALRDKKFVFDVLLFAVLGTIILPLVTDVDLTHKGTFGSVDEINGYSFNADLLSNKGFSSNSAAVFLLLGDGTSIDLMRSATSLLTKGGTKQSADMMHLSIGN